MGRRTRAGGPGHGSCPGALLGATALTRPEYLPFAAVFGLLALVRVGRRRSWRLGLVSAALLVGTFALVLAPWTVRNYVVLDRFVPVTTGGGKALFVATYLPGNGRQLQVKRALIKRYTGERLRLARGGARHGDEEPARPRREEVPGPRARRGARAHRARELPQVLLGAARSPT